MQINFSGHLDRDFREMLVNQKVTVQVTFDVDRVEFNISDEGYENVSGNVRSVQILNKQGGGGLNATVVRAEKNLRALRTMGTNA